MSSIIATFSAIKRMASTVLDTVVPPSAACCAALAAMLSVICALSAFCFTELEICSSDAEISSTLLACSVVAWLKLCVVADTWVEALVSASEVLRISVTVCDRRTMDSFIAFSNWPNSSRRSLWLRKVKLPSASWRTAWAAICSGVVMLRNSAMDKPIASSTPIAAVINIVSEVLSKFSTAACCLLARICSSRSCIKSSSLRIASKSFAALPVLSSNARRRDSASGCCTIATTWSVLASQVSRRPV